MKKTFVDVLLELPVDTTLSAFLASHGLPVAVISTGRTRRAPRRRWWRPFAPGPTSPPATV